VKVVADTMMWVSFTTHPNGFRSRLIETALKRRVRFFVSQYQLDEFVNTLTEHLELPRRFARNSRQTLEILAKTVQLPTRIPRFVECDLKDDAIVQTALSARADYLVTADQEILRLKKVGNVAIITAAEFARQLGWSPK
jgi:putative PIN family toxin of toxin-antitoxin system